MNMKKTTILFAMFCIFAMAFAHIAVAEEKEFDITGKWTATIHTNDNTVTEQWDLTHEGNKVKGTIKNTKGTHDVTGTIDGKIVRALMKEGEQNHQVHLTVDGDDMDGTIRMGKNEFLLMLRRTK